MYAIHMPTLGWFGGVNVGIYDKHDRHGVYGSYTYHHDAIKCDIITYGLGLS